MCVVYMNNNMAAVQLGKQVKSTQKGNIYYLPMQIRSILQNG